MSTIIAIDQGTTSTRAIAFDADARPIATAQKEYRQYYPHPGWVEQDPEDIWRDTVETVSAVIDGPVSAIGITNQRETLVVWDRATGEPIHRAIVWQDRRTADRCAALMPHESLVRARTGLLLDPYFSATKLAWILDTIPGARRRAERGELAFGTIDSFLLWRLTGGRVHATDATNASRTMLFDIYRQRWCPDLLALFGIPEPLLPEVRDSNAFFGTTAAELFGTPIPIRGIAGDQHAALIGHGCRDPGTAKATYGTGGFLLVNSGDTLPPLGDGLIGTIAYRLDGKTTYAVEGSIFIAGAAIKWLRDQLGIITDAAQTEALAAGLPDTGGVHFIPAFVGLGAPYWRPDVRAAITGLTLDSGRAHIARAALEAVAFQTADLIAAMGLRPDTLRVDGGMVANGWLCGFLADLLGVSIERPPGLEITARGAALLAGMATGSWRYERFEPAMATGERDRLLVGWRAAIERMLQN